MTAAASLDGESLFSVALNNAMKTTPPEFTVTYAKWSRCSKELEDMTYNSPFYFLYF
uniref:Uncharacterized protein n=1 Tax=Arundo donax TaxID=35708 RepID=A0A0A9BLU8_ARUDO